MFGTLGFSELIIILVIVLIIFGAGRLPQIGEGIGKALKGFKKEVNQIPVPPDPAAATAESPPRPQQAAATGTPIEEAQVVRAPQQASAPKPTAPYTPGPELTPGTTAAMMAAGALPQKARAPRPNAVPSPAAAVASPPTMEDRMAQPAPALRQQYPSLPPTARATPAAKRPSAIVNTDAVARVQAQQAALRAKSTQANEAAGLTGQDMQNLGEGLGDTLRSFRQAVADVRSSIDPEMRTIRAEI
ncbi:MAG: twin-arginine translocase TatA/TatE family subunit, partial [Nitrospirae bacterium]|nr:twin-arginine translocase TatA/TatE family subunit [Nitrospirota bacterium]